MKHKYNRLYVFKRIALQILLSTERRGIVIALIPAIDLVINGENLVLGIGLQWIFGHVNFGLMQREFVTSEQQRRKTVASNAAQRGLTIKQYTLRWL